MDDGTSGEQSSPEPDRKDPSWLPLVAGFLGLIVGAALGGLVGLKNGPDDALKLAVIGGFLGMVVVVVPVNSWLRSHDDTDQQSEHSKQSGATRQRPHALSRLAGSQSVARVPDGGLPIRSVPNRNADPTGSIEGGAVVRVVRRSGNWVRIQTNNDEEPIWLDRRRLEPTDAPFEESEPG